MDEILNLLRYIFKYRDSVFFRDELFVDEEGFLKSLTLNQGEFFLKNEELLKELVSLTEINLDELKVVLGVANFYNILTYLYEVNTSIKNLLKKNENNKNYIVHLINQRKREGLFKNLNKNKFKDILSLFSEILCISNVTAGREEFVVSSDAFCFEYRRNGKFDLVLKQKSINRYYYFDVKRVTLDEAFINFNDQAIERKIKDLIGNISIKGACLNRPLFLIIDCSDISVIEELDGIDKETGNNKYNLKWNGDRIHKILKNFFNNNINIMPELKEIGGIGLFFWSMVVQKDRKDIELLFWHMPYTNFSSNYNGENEILLEINNILFDMLGKEHDALLPNTGKFELLGIRKLK